MNIFFNGMKYSLVLFTLLVGEIVMAKPMILPDHEGYKDFLISPWKPDAPTLVVFKDPYCPYCVKALKHLDKLDNYNVFMFWAPILGKASVVKVNQILACTSPAGINVVDAVIQRSQISCEQSNNERLKELNMEVVDSYDPNSVPSYYFGGKKVQLSTLNITRSKLLPDLTPTKLNWSRYNQLKAGQVAHNGLLNTIIFTPSKLRSTLDRALASETLYSWYLVDQYCLPQQSCTSVEKKAQELRLLLGQETVSIPTVFIDGRKIESHDYSKYFSSTLIERLMLTQ